MKTGTGCKEYVILLLFAIFASACGPNEGILKSGKPDPNLANATPTVSTVERDVADMRTADFVTIIVVRRRDGGTMDAADRGVIRDATAEANRRIGSEDDRAFVIGSNQPIALEKLRILTDRFAVENYSPPTDVIPANAANANK
jgi:hypothetical protein